MKPFLKCDAPGCDHREMVEAMTEDLIGKPCPKCGADLLTREDYEAGAAFAAMMEQIQAGLEEMGSEIQMADGSAPVPEGYKKLMAISVSHHAGSTTIEVRPANHEETSQEATE